MSRAGISARVDRQPAGRGFRPLPVLGSGAGRRRPGQADHTTLGALFASGRVTAPMACLLPICSAQEAATRHDQAHLIQLGAEGNQLADLLKSASPLSSCFGAAAGPPLPACSSTSTRQGATSSSTARQVTCAGPWSQTPPSPRNNSPRPSSTWPAGGSSWVDQVAVVKPVHAARRPESCETRRCGYWPPARRVRWTTAPLRLELTRELAVGTVQGQLQLIGQVTAYRDRLIELEPVR